jgi:hypothetical protein
MPHYIRLVIIDLGAGRGAEDRCADGQVQCTLPFGSCIPNLVPGKRIARETLSEEPLEKTFAAFVAFQEAVELVFSLFLDLQEFNAYLIKTFGCVASNIIPADLADRGEWRLIRDKFDGHVQTVFARAGSSRKQMDAFDLQGFCF